MRRNRFKTSHAIAALALCAALGGCFVPQAQLEGKRCSAEVPCPEGYLCLAQPADSFSVCRDEKAACAAAGVSAASEEVCDGVDNDCDGAVDDREGCLVTLAGSGPPGFIDGPAEDAHLGGPMYLTPDGEGGFYLADAYAHAVRHVAADGAVTTIAGTGRCGYTDGPATQAAFCGPIEVIPTPQGLYVSDSMNHRIRRIHAGVVTTVAGSGVRGARDGEALQAELDQPRGMHLLADGTLLIAERGNHLIRRYDSQTGQLHRYAGTPRESGSTDGALDVMQFAGPQDITQDAAGTLYVSDQHRIRKIAAGVGSTLAGASGRNHDDGAPSVARFFSPSQLAVDEVEGKLVVADRLNNRMRWVHLTTGNTETFSGTWYSGFWNQSTPGHRQPAGVAVLGHREYLVGDVTNHRLRKLRVVEGKWTAFDFSGGPHAQQLRDGPATTQARLASPIGLAVTSSGKAVWSESTFNLVRMLSGGVVSTVAGDAVEYKSGRANGVGGEARLDDPGAVATFGDDVVFVVDEGNHGIRRIDLTTGQVSLLTGAPDGTEGYVDGALADARFAKPRHLVAGRTASGSRALYVGEPSRHVIRLIDLDAQTVSTFAGVAGTSGYQDGPKSVATLDYIHALAADEAGNVWYADKWNNAQLRHIGPDGTITTLSGDVGFDMRVIAFHPPGKLLLAGDSLLEEFDLASRKQRRIWPADDNVALEGWQDGDATGGVLWDVRGLVVRPEAFYLTDHSARRVRKLWRVTP